MKHIRVDGYDMAYMEVGLGMPIVCIHGTLCDFRIWSAVLGPLSRRHRVITASLRYFFPEHWDGVGKDFTIDQHVADVIALIEALDAGPVHLVGHSRGGQVAFRVAQRRPDILLKLVLAEPGTELDASLAPSVMPASPLGPTFMVATKSIAAGDIDGGLKLLADAVDGQGAWLRMTEADKQQARDNALTLLGQIGEQRKPYTRADAESIRVPTLLVGGADRPGPLTATLRALAASIPNARVATIPGTDHLMFVQEPVRFCAIVSDFFLDQDPTSLE